MTDVGLRTERGGGWKETLCCAVLVIALLCKVHPRASRA
jgi:hypothetical protein